jgi:hypothetical protein
MEAAEQTWPGGGEGKFGGVQVVPAAQSHFPANHLHGKRVQRSALQPPIAAVDVDVALASRNGHLHGCWQPLHSSSISRAKQTNLRIY